MFFFLFGYLFSAAHSSQTTYVMSALIFFRQWELWCWWFEEDFDKQDILKASGIGICVIKFNLIFNATKTISYYFCQNSLQDPMTNIMLFVIILRSSHKFRLVCVTQTEIVPNTVHLFYWSLFNFIVVCLHSVIFGVSHIPGTGSKGNQFHSHNLWGQLEILTVDLLTMLLLAKEMALTSQDLIS